MLKNLYIKWRSLPAGRPWLMPFGHPEIHDHDVTYQIPQEEFMHSFEELKEWETPAMAIWTSRDS